VAARRIPDKVLGMLSPATVAVLIIERGISDWPHEFLGARITWGGLMRAAVLEEKFRREGVVLEGVTRTAEEAKELVKQGYA